MRARIEIPRFDPDALKLARREAGLTRTALGKRLRRSRHAVLTWEDGTAPIPAQDLRAVAEIFGCTPADLQHPPPGEPTLADQRMRLGLTVDELCERFHHRERQPTTTTWRSHARGGDRERHLVALPAWAIGAGRIHIRVRRLKLWEETGRLGSADEERNPIALASLLGTYVDSITTYLSTGELPRDIAGVLAAGLLLPVTHVQAAFAASRRAHDDESLEDEALDDDRAAGEQAGIPVLAGHR
ncbi:hypothetical protein Lesp02_03690 [Lentzea sp. NBRC 105346]|uniref:helix-turn-helix domain-containing protein n=1 Tax=Lentzea sp. NBRC 105346 TaxID=3032205 RepID=UPI0024A3950D|nr:helix-turn-helix transcriptional regulator [Lentzea sp. NBRC 105346]GLZ28179.1 hypothetical protein Lesp02_03690 [Lentzea sp. NBRC 105346]